MQNKDATEVHNISLKIPFKQKTIDCLLSTYPTPKSAPSRCVILTHGAGGDMNHAQLVEVCNRLCYLGYRTARFTCKGLNIVHRINVFRAVMMHIKDKYRVEKFIVGGRSMGARAAVTMVSQLTEDQSQAIEGVICLSYPLINQSKPQEPRDTPLYSVNKPLLFVSGDRDEMCNPKLMASVIDNIKSSEVKMQWIEGEDHSLTSKCSQSMDTVCDVVTAWCQSL